MERINNAINLAVNYKPYKLGGRNLECCPDDNCKYRTAIPDFKLRDIGELILQKQDVLGDVIEIGVWRGGFGLFINALLPDKFIYLVDTFEGIPHTTSMDNYHQLKDFDDCSFDEVVQVFKELAITKVLVIKGIFPQDVSMLLNDKTFSIVHLDVDVYQSYKDSLEYLYPRLVTDGIILLDDYNEATCAGATKAVDEFVHTNSTRVKVYKSIYYVEK